MCKYSIIVKTGEAEIQAIENSRKEILEKIFPLIEITRGRKTKKGYPFKAPPQHASLPEGVRFAGGVLTASLVDETMTCILQLRDRKSVV